MATKTEKRHAEKRKQELKEAQEKLENLTQNQIYQLENYTVFEILYINDAASNECRFLESKLNAMPYRSKAIRKIYNALMKRVNAYWEMIYSTTIDKDSLANLFGNIDDYMDEPISELKNAIQKVLEENEVPHADWVASVETAYTLCHFAEMSSLELIQKVSKWSKEVYKMKAVVISSITDVARSLTESVQEIHMGNKYNIDLNTNPTTMRAFKRMYKAFSDPRMFLNAAKSADEENEKEGRMKLM